MDLLLIWLVGRLVGAFVGERNGRLGQGAVLGILLGPIGWLVVGLGPDYGQAKETKKCPFCAELVKPEAKVCKHCGRDLPATDLA
jgi:zinc-ribbon domain